MVEVARVERRKRESSNQLKKQKAQGKDLEDAMKSAMCQECTPTDAGPSRDGQRHNSQQSRALSPSP